MVNTNIMATFPKVEWWCRSAQRRRRQSSWVEVDQEPWCHVNQLVTAHQLHQRIGLI